MILLLYCVFENSAGPIPRGVAGVNGLTIKTLFSSGLGAAVSDVARDDLKPNVARGLAYGEAIEVFHKNLTVIPMRYGSILQDESAVARLLTRNEESFKRLLQKLRGCVEMGVTILLPENLSESASVSKWREPSERVIDAPGVPRGRAYLESRRRAFDDRDLLEEAGKQAVKNCKAALNGLYIDVKVEERVSVPHLDGLQPKNTPLGTSTALVHFLVPKDRLEAFCRSFEQLPRQNTNGIRLSGPWPPYNFATISLNP